ncbi:UNVERIFIED_CONTAM: hypothetical protein FKN15_025271 [Acipenser sinensis]
MQGIKNYISHNPPTPSRHADSPLQSLEGVAGNCSSLSWPVALQGIRACP